MNIGEQAFGQGLEPQDPIEWMPFLQAYALKGNIDRLTELAPKVSADPFIARQACQVFEKMSGLSLKVLETMDELYCSQ